MRYVIFPAGPSDAEALAHVHVQSWRESYRGLLPDAFLDGMSEAAYARRWVQTLTFQTPGEATLVLADRPGPVGYASGGPWDGRGWRVSTLYLLRSAQRQGEGRRLLTALVRVFADQGGGPLTISALRDNAAARGFYMRMGGAPQAPRFTAGPGGIVCEVNYFWPDVAALLDAV